MRLENLLQTVALNIFPRTCSISSPSLFTFDAMNLAPSIIYLNLIEKQILDVHRLIHLDLLAFYHQRTPQTNQSSIKTCIIYMFLCATCTKHGYSNSAFFNATASFGGDSPIYVNTYTERTNKNLINKLSSHFQKCHF